MKLASSPVATGGLLPASHTVGLDPLSLARIRERPRSLHPPDGEASPSLPNPSARDVRFISNDSERLPWFGQKSTSGTHAGCSSRQWRSLEGTNLGILPGWMPDLPTVPMAKQVHVLNSAEYQAIITELPKCSPTASFVVGGTSYTTAQVVALASAVLDATSAVPKARAAADAAVTAANAKEATNGPIIKGVREILAVMFSSAPDTLVALDIAPKKSRKTLSSEAKVAAAAKSEATRAARGTKGKKQKATILGNVTGVSIVPITAPSAASAATGVAAASTASGTNGASAPVVSAASATTALGSVPLVVTGASHS